ncbi:MAG: ankyrin repeat domain-containing protein [Epsilonproteobacteria bacterium]|nr:ankyrin repeat domain-containing protein [Campylobacterota bacterium]
MDERLIEAIKRDSLLEVEKILKSQEIDLNQDISIAREYNLEEDEEIPFIFYLVLIGASLDMFKLLLKYGLDINYATKEGLSLIDYAIKHRRIDILKLCKESGFNLNESRRKSKITPLMLAASFNDQEIAEYLINEGVSIDKVDNFGMNALDYARKLGQKRMEEFLKSKGAKHHFYKK